MRAASNKPAPGVTSKLMTKVLGGIGTHASVVVKIVHKDQSVRTWIMCELSVDTDGLTLIMVCPSCLFRHHRKVEDSHITMRSWHRKFSLDSVGAGEFWTNPENRSEVVRLAGTIETHESQTCPVCSFKFQLEKSKVPSEKGLTVLREA
jgi:hypothetical protein